MTTTPMILSKGEENIPDEDDNMLKDDENDAEKDTEDPGDIGDENRKDE
ncbi:hypothetical protein [Bacillus sp. SA1-12]|nr:hypothetical protein [Bacillus sp. SA1-12]